MRFNRTNVKDYDYKKLAKDFNLYNESLQCENIIMMYSDDDEPIGYGYFLQIDTKKVTLKEINIKESYNTLDNQYEIYKALENYAYQKGYETLIDEINGKKISLTKKYKVLLLDLDETIFDFKESEKKAFLSTMKKFKVKVNENHALKFSMINEDCFKEFQNNELTRIEFQEKRFYEFFDFLGVDVDIKKANEFYIKDLSSRADLFEYSLKCVKSLSEKYKLCAVSNGMYDVQISRLKQAKLDKYFRKIYVSSEIGYSKPSKEFFDYIFNDLKFNKLEDFLIIGDREDSDMQGGINARIDTCYYNVTKKAANKMYTYEINEFKDILLKI